MQLPWPRADPHTNCILFSMSCCVLELLSRHHDDCLPVLCEYESLARQPVRCITSPSSRISIQSSYSLRFNPFQSVRCSQTIFTKHIRQFTSNFYPEQSHTLSFFRARLTNTLNRHHRRRITNAASITTIPKQQ